MGILNKLFKQKKPAKRSSGTIKYTDIHGKKKTISREEIDKHKAIPRTIIIREKAKPARKKTRRKSRSAMAAFWKHLV